MRVMAYGLDYIRFVVRDDDDLLHIQKRLDYVNVIERKYHGVRCVNLSGSDLAVIRTVERADGAVAQISRRLGVTRIDVFVDIESDVLPKCKQPGTVIMNGGRTETIYSTRLDARGDVPTFARAYDAREAGHYDVDATRFECEYKLHKARALLSKGVWRHSPVSVALFDIKAIYGISISIDGAEHVEFNPPRKRIESDREKFYTRYGKGIINDINNLGMRHWITYVSSCAFVRKEKAREKHNG